MGEACTYTHPDGAPPSRADKALAEFFGAKTSRTKMESSFAEGKVRIGGKPIAKRFMLHAGDLVEIELPDSPETEVKPVEIPVEILYEDNDVVAVNKPAGMTVHPGSGTGEDTLCHAMMHHCGGNLSLAGGPLRPGIVHRLDKETSGVMLMAKTDDAYYRLVEMFSKHELYKEYAALICGVPTVRSGIITKNIARHPLFKTKMCASDDIESGRDARTEWFVEKAFGSRAALVRCNILTGRTHQIRVHMSSMGFPIIGDYTYAFQKNKLKDIMAPERVMLHARRLKLEHPTLRGKTLDLSAQPPKDFKMLAEELERVYG